MGQRRRGCAGRQETRPWRLRGLLCLLSALLVVTQWGLCHLVEAVAVGSYYATVVLLETLERVGLPTLTGSPSGWPVPTGLGLVFAAVGWFLLYLGVLSATVVLARRLRQGGIQSTA